jgi:hypothetical protein
MADHSQMRLGKNPARHDLLRMARATVALSKLPPPPDAVDWTNGVTSWGEMLNDSLGDCTCAGVGHAVQVATLQVDGEVTPGDNLVLEAYEKWAGYDDTKPWTDQGAVEADILECWERDGFAGYKLLAHVEPNPQLVDHIKQALAHFGALYIGATLPMSAQSQDVWDVGPGADGGVWGGHCVDIVAYDKDGLTCITWGGLKKMTWAWWLKYVDEAHCLLIDEWLKRYPASAQADVLAMMQDVNA